MLYTFGIEGGDGGEGGIEGGGGGEGLGGGGDGGGGEGEGGGGKSENITSPKVIMFLAYRPSVLAVMIRLKN